MTARGPRSVCPRLPQELATKVFELDDPHPHNDALSAAHQAVLTHSTRHEFDITPYMQAIELLESLPWKDFIDDRVKVALDVVEHLGSERAELGLRALHAAKPPGAVIQDPHHQRKWLSFVGVLEMRLGNVGSALPLLSASLRLATELNDVIGVAAAWNNLALLASGAGQFEDAVQYTTLSLKIVEGDQHEAKQMGNLLSICYVNRAEALYRLGRLEQALADAAHAIAHCFPPVGGLFDITSQEQRVLSLCLLAQMRVERRELVHADALLESAERMHSNSAARRSGQYYIDSVKGQLMVARGFADEGVNLMESALNTTKQLAHYYFCDDVVMHLLHCLHRTCRELGWRDKANVYLVKMGERLRRNAEKAQAAFTAYPYFSCHDSESGSRVVERYLRGLAQETPPLEPGGSPSWHYLVNMAASACAIEEPSGEHGLRVASLCGYVARAIELSEDIAQGIEQAGLLHDLGKVGVPSDVLTKRTPLSVHETDLLERHADDGAHLIERSDIDNRAWIAKIVRLHHRRFDSKDFADSPRDVLASSILAACDQFDAIVMGRPRQQPASVNEALVKLLTMSGGELDPRVVSVLVDTIRRLRRQHENLMEFLADAAGEYSYTLARRKLREVVQRVLPS